MTDTLTHRAPALSEGPLPPQSLDAERSVLAAMMLDYESIGRALELLDPNSFYRTAHQRIFEAIVGLYNRNEKADLVTVAEELRKRGDLDAVGGPPALSQVMEYAATSANLEEHAKLVHEKALLRSLIRSAGEIQQECYADSDETGAILDRAEQRIFAITDTRIRQGLVPLRELLKPAFEQIQALYERKALVTGVPSGYEDLDRLTAGFQRGDLVIVAGRPAMGKCLTANSLIDDPDTGERLSIEDAVRKQLPNVMGVSETGGIRSAAVGTWMDSGVKPCFRVTTRLGRGVEVTGQHPFLTVHGWLPLHDLRSGMQIAVPRSLPVFGAEDGWSLSRVRLLAYFIAEGGLTSRCPRFTNTDPVIVEHFHAALGSEFPECEARLANDITWRVVARKGLGKRQPNGAPSPNPVTLWLHELGLMGKLSAEKCFPACVWRWPRRHLVEFIRALFSCDGTIYGLRGVPRIEFTVASQKLAEDVRHALTRLRIVAKLGRRAERSWRVEITDQESLKLYQEQVGWTGEKAERFAGHEHDVTARHSIRGYVGREAWGPVRLSADIQEMTLAELGRRAGEPVRRGFDPHRGRGIPRRRLEVCARCLEDPELARMVSPDLYWDEIVSIEPIGEQRVYDLGVPDGANFIANDVVVHNSSLAINIVENAAIQHKIPAAIFSLEMSKEQLVLRMLGSQSEVSLSKIRNGYLAQEDWPRLTTGAGLLTQAPIMIDDSAALTVFEIRAKCRRLRAEGKLGLVVVDYLQLIRPSGRPENRVQEISQITRGLKALSKELEVPIIALSQLSRAVEQRGGDRRPQLSDLRESGCLTADTRIWRADTGAEVPLGELLLKGERDVPVWTLDASLRLVQGRMTRVFPSGVKPIFELRLASGRSVKGSANHPFLTVDGWRRVDQLEAGDRLAIPRHMPRPIAPQEWPESEVVMLAHLLGEGCFASRQPLHYTSADEENLRPVEAAAAHFGITSHRVPQGNWHHVCLPSPYRLTQGRRNPVHAWLARFGLNGLRSHEKFIPREVFGLEDMQVALFIRHLWATNGSLVLGEGDRQARIHYASSSRRLVSDLQSLLLRLGILGRIRRVQKPDYRPGYHLHIYGVDPQIRFLEEIGVHGARGRGTERILEFLRGLKPSTNVDTVPRQVWRRDRPAMAYQGVTARDLAAGLGTAHCFSKLYPRAPSRERLGRVAVLVDDPDVHELAESHVFWDTIVAIEPRGEETVFDATVPDTHNFIADGIVAHNSVEQDADVVIFVYRPEYYKPDDPALKGKATIILAKQRNGPTADVTLTFLRECTKFVPYSPITIEEEGGEPF